MVQFVTTFYCFKLKPKQITNSFPSPIPYSNPISVISVNFYSKNNFFHITMIIWDTLEAMILLMVNRLAPGRVRPCDDTLANS